MKEEQIKKEKPHLKAVGYNSTVAALITLIGIPEDMSAVNE